MKAIHLIVVLDGIVSPILHMRKHAQRGEVTAQVPVQEAPVCFRISGSGTHGFASTTWPRSTLPQLVGLGPVYWPKLGHSEFHSRIFEIGIKGRDLAFSDNKAMIHEIISHDQSHDPLSTEKAWLKK